jgi:hypothetical protein
MHNGRRRKWVEETMGWQRWLLAVAETAPGMARTWAGNQGKAGSRPNPERIQRHNYIKM